MNFHIITLFPEMFDSYINESILGRAIKNKKIKVNFINPRKFVTGKYKKVWPDGNISLQVDDRPYGGGPGMVMRAEPIIKAVEFTQASIIKKHLKSKIFSEVQPPKPALAREVISLNQGWTSKQILVVNFVPSAEKFDTKIAKNLSRKYTDIIMICGRYEGIDARADKILKTKKISIGDYVLTGGEIPAMILVDSISRQIEGVLGNFNSREEERVSSSEIYTRPEILIHNNKKYKVPPILLSGHQKKIEEWKSKHK
jgi:tRNA (guanine37-N1)-methyltransferase